MRLRARPLAVVVLLTIAGAGCVGPGTPPDVDTASGSGVDAPAQQEATDDPMPQPTAASKAPVVAGEYRGKLTITVDTNRVNSSSMENESLAGTTLTRTLRLAPGCDLAGEVCEASHQSLWMDTPGVEDPSTWEVPLGAVTTGPDSWAATFTEQYDDDCVSYDGVVVGTFHTTATTSVTLSRAGDDGAGALSWLDAHVVYREDSVGSSSDAECYTSEYTVEGMLTRDAVPAGG